MPVWRNLRIVSGELRFRKNYRLSLASKRQLIESLAFIIDENYRLSFPGPGLRVLLLSRFEQRLLVASAQHLPVQVMLPSGVRGESQLPPVRRPYRICIVSRMERLPGENPARDFEGPEVMGPHLW